MPGPAGLHGQTSALPSAFWQAVRCFIALLTFSQLCILPVEYGSDCICLLQAFVLHWLQRKDGKGPVDLATSDAVKELLKSPAAAS